PLTSIYGASELLMKYYGDRFDDRAKALVDIINNGGKRLNTLIEDLIDVSKMESGKLELKKQKENIVEIIKNCLNDMLFLVKERDLSLSFDFQRDIYIEVDKIRIEQVIMNLISNAIKNTPPKGTLSINLKDAQALGKIGYWEFDIDNQKIFWSDQVFKLYKRDPSLGAPTPEEETTYYSPMEAKRLREYVRRTIEYGKGFEYDFEANLPNGRAIQLTALMRPIREKSGRVFKLIGTVQDITARKKAEEEIREAKKFLSNIFNSIQDGISIIDSNFNIISINPVIEKWYS
ncbi:unnamed protein product, partial [marine sediment metagenome]